MRTEAELIAELRDAEGGLVARPVAYPQGASQDVQLEAVDPRLEASLEGARERLDQLQTELRGFASRSLRAFAVERAPRARAAAERCADALRELHAAAAAYEQERTWWAGVLRDADRTDWAAPGNPLAMVNEAPREVVPPIPEPLR